MLRKTPQFSEVARDPARVGSGRYSAVAIALHWAIALAIVLQIILAGRMEGPRTPTSFAVTQLHKSVGISILLLTLLRIAWRLANPPPPMPVTLAPWERQLARITHFGFYFVMLGMPLTGWLMVSAAKTLVPTLLYGVVPWPMIPGVSSLAPAARRLAHTIGETGHGAIAKLIYVLLALHVAGALKHQLFSRDEPVLARMAPGAAAGRWWDPRIYLIAAAFLGVIAFGRWVTPPSPGLALPAAAAAAPAPAVPAPAPAAAAPEPNAAPAPAAAVQPPPAGPVAWKAQKGSTLGFATTWSGAPLNGRFERWTANILFSPDDLAHSRVTVAIDMSSAKTGDDQRDAALPSSDWFDAAAHPKAVFTATRFDHPGGDRYVAHGTLSLRGVSKSVDLPFRLAIAGATAEVTGQTSLDRQAFGVGQGDFAATDQVPARVGVRVQLTAVRDQR
jgi:cytochrome b561/polyisoprenoid-binding protein YceI